MRFFLLLFICLVSSNVLAVPSRITYFLGNSYELGNSTNPNEKPEKPACPDSEAPGGCYSQRPDCTWVFECLGEQICEDHACKCQDDNLVFNPQIGQCCETKKEGQITVSAGSYGHCPQYVCPTDSVLDKELNKCICDASKGLYGKLGSCETVACIPNAERITFNGYLTFCTEHDRYVRLDTLENKVRLVFLDGWNGLHNYDYGQYGCRCSQYNTYNDAELNGHYTDATVHKMPYADYSLKFPIYISISGVGCDAGTYAITAPNTYFHVGTCPGGGSTEANISYNIQSEITGYKCPIEGGICSKDNKCVEGNYESSGQSIEDICGMPGATSNCYCPFDKVKINGSCNWKCEYGQVMNDKGVCACPIGTVLQNNWCRNTTCLESAGKYWDPDELECRCNTSAKYYPDANGNCILCSAYNSAWNEEKKTCDVKCATPTYTVASPHYSAQYPAARWNAQTEQCECNPDIFFFGDYPNCIRCNLPGTALDLENGTCNCESQNMMKQTTGICTACDDPELYPTAEKESCQICMNKEQRYWRANYKQCIRCDDPSHYVGVEQGDCTCANRFWHSSKYCIDCNNASHHAPVLQEECHRCSNRFWRASDNYCIICDNASTHPNTTKDECERCPNRYWTETVAATHLGNCALCPNGASRGADGKCGCTANEITLSTGACTTCDATTTYYATTAKTNCQPCIDAKKRYWRNSDKLCIRCDDPSHHGAIEQADCTCGNHFWHSGKYCLNCNEAAHHAPVLQEECHRCPNRFWRASDNYCIICDNASTHPSTTKDECERCPNRYWTETVAATHLGNCALCPNGASRGADGKCGCAANEIVLSTGACTTCDVTDLYPVMMDKDNCQPCMDAKQRYWRANYKQCIRCDDPSHHQGVEQGDCTCANRFWHSSKYCIDCNNASHHAPVLQEECHRCPNRFWRASDNYCIICDNASTHGNTTKDECERCPNRYWTETVAATHLGNCALCPNGASRGADGKCDCPANEVMINTGACTTCDSTIQYHTMTAKTNCQPCMDAKKRYWRENYKQCFRCDDVNYYQGVEQGDCACENRFWHSGKYCIECENATLHYPVLKEECARCPNRVWAPYSNGVCAMCPAGFPSDDGGLACVCPKNQFWNRGGNGSTLQCAACSSVTAVYATKNQCHKCANQFYITGFSDDLCYGCDENRYSVDSAQKTTSLSECARCPKRYLDKNKICRICPAGKYCLLEEDGSDAIDCPAGSYCPEGTHEPILCPIGKYRNTVGASDASHCVACTAGTTSNESRTGCI